MGSTGKLVTENSSPITTKLDDMDIDEIRDYVFEKLGVVKSNDDDYFDAVSERAKLMREHDELWEKYKENEELLKKEKIPYQPKEDEIKETMEDLDITREEAIRELRDINRFFPEYTEKGKELDKKSRSLMDKINANDKRRTELNEEIENIEKRRQFKEEDTMNFVYERFTRPTETKNVDFSKIKGFALTGSGQRMLESEGDNAYISVMSPKEYLQRITYDIFATRENGSYMEKTLRINWANVKKYAKQMREGTKFDIPWLDYDQKGQEGRHRAIAALLNGYTEIPVAVRKKR